MKKANSKLVKSLSQNTWAKYWNTSNTPWCRRKANSALRMHQSHLRKFGLPKASNVLIPLCGNSPAIALLHRLGHYVSGVEFVAKALKRLREEQFPKHYFKHSSESCGTVFTSDRITLYQGDIYKFNAPKKFDLIYDRGALVAIAPKDRRKYVRVLDRSLMPGGLLFLVCFDRDTAREDGPPYPVSLAEISKLFRSYKVRLKKVTQTKQPLKHKKTSTSASPANIVVILQKPKSRKNRNKPN